MTFGYCATCRIKLKVTHVRYTDTSAIRRKRCLHCDAKSVTDEIARSRLTQLIAAEQELIVLKGNIALPVASDEELHESELNAEGEFLLARMKKGFGYKQPESVAPQDDPTTEDLNDMVRKLMPPGTV